MDFSKVKQIKIKEGIVTKIRHVASDTILWVSKILETITGKFPLLLEKSTGEELVGYKIYGDSVQPTELYNPDLWQDGFINSSGSAEPVESSSYPNAKFFKIALKQEQVVQFTVEPNDIQKGRVRYIDPETNTVMGTVGTGSSGKDYITSTASESSGFKTATLTALKDVTLAFMDISGGIDVYTNFSLTTSISPSSPIEIESVGDYTGLPYGYTRLDYIQNPSKQYIDTGVAPSTAGKLYVKFEPVSVNSNYLCGSRTSSILYSGVMGASGGKTVNTTMARDGSTTSAVTFSLIRYTGNVYELDSEAKYYEGEGYTTLAELKNLTTGEAETLESSARVEVPVTIKQTMCLFAVSKNEIIVNTKIYSYKYWDNDRNLIIDYVPCKNPNGIAGMYDSVSGQFFPSSSSSDFEAGNEIDIGGYRVPVKVSGKNLFGKVNTPIGGYLGANGEFQSGTVARQIKFLEIPKGVTSISKLIKDWVSSDYNYVTRIGFYDENKTMISVDTGFGFTASSILPIPTKAKYIQCSIAIKDAEGTVICWGDETITDYIPYVDPTTTNIYLSEPLRKIGDYSDYVDFENGKVVRNVGILGTEELAKEFSGGGLASSTYIGSQYVSLYSVNGNQIHFTKYFFGGRGSSAENKFRVLCNKLTALNSTFEKNYKYGMVGVDGALNLYLGTTKPTAITEMAQRIRDLNIELILPLTNPTEESIDLPPVLTQKGTNIISIETKIEPSNGEVKYYKG